MRRSVGVVVVTGVDPVVTTTAVLRARAVPFGENAWQPRMETEPLTVSVVPGWDTSRHRSSCRQKKTSTANIAALRTPKQDTVLVEATARVQLQLRFVAIVDVVWENSPLCSTPGVTRCVGVGDRII